jgi:hypothetical protein
MQPQCRKCLKASFEAARYTAKAILAYEELILFDIGWVVPCDKDGLSKYLEVSIGVPRLCEGRLVVTSAPIFALHLLPSRRKT